MIYLGRKCFGSNVSEMLMDMLLSLADHVSDLTKDGCVKLPWKKTISVDYLEVLAKGDVNLKSVIQNDLQRTK